MLETAGSTKVGMGGERVAQGHRGQLGQVMGEVGRWQNMMAEKGQAAENAFELALGLYYHISLQWLLFDQWWEVNKGFFFVLHKQCTRKKYSLCSKL
jgi:hypothetical protein